MFSWKLESCKKLSDCCAAPILQLMVNLKGKLCNIIQKLSRLSLCRRLYIKGLIDLREYFQSRGLWCLGSNLRSAKHAGKERNKPHQGANGRSGSQTKKKTPNKQEIRGMTSKCTLSATDTASSMTDDHWLASTVKLCCSSSRGNCPACLFLSLYLRRNDDCRSARGF